MITETVLQKLLSVISQNKCTVLLKCQLIVHQVFAHLSLENVFSLMLNMAYFRVKLFEFFRIQQLQMQLVIQVLLLQLPLLKEHIYLELSLVVLQINLIVVMMDHAKMIQVCAQFIQLVPILHFLTDVLMVHASLIINYVMKVG